MYFSIGILLFILLTLVLCFWRRHWAMKQVCTMEPKEKLALLDTILAPFGYCYHYSQDIVSTRNDAWQRQTGYTALFDQAALHLHMVFDSLPIYFDYHGRTWLIELWKGQYGINTGGEVGVYYADRILSRDELSTAHFQAVEDEDCLPITAMLSKSGYKLAEISKKTWWLTSFSVGMFSQPSQLTLDVTMLFPSIPMQQSFLAALRQISSPDISFQSHKNVVHICMRGSTPSASRLTRIRVHWALFCNRFFCRLYCFITRYFCTTLDSILYLYKLLPFILRRMLRRLKGVIHG